jgi:hypothetical protein
MTGSNFRIKQQDQLYKIISRKIKERTIEQNSFVI